MLEPTVTVELPWPPNGLSPNAHGIRGPNSRFIIMAAREGYTRDCLPGLMKAKEELRAKGVALPLRTPVGMVVEVSVASLHVDWDNLAARLKPAQDQLVSRGILLEDSLRYLCPVTFTYNKVKTAQKGVKYHLYEADE